MYDLVMSIKEVLESLTFERAPGPSPSFSIFDVIKALRIIAEAGSVGRGKLSEKLELGEGATRTLLARLAEARLISTSRSGCSLTGEGRNIWKKIEEVIPHISEIGHNELTFAAYNIVVQIKGKGEKIGKGLEQRDAAVRAGAKGAITLVYRDKKLILPSITDDAAQSYPIACQQISRLMNLEENDVAIIVCADSLKDAEYGALAAAWTII